jgi:hypothetical protein
MIKEPIKIDFENKSLKTPNYEYVVKTNLSMSHYIQFELTQPQAAYGYTFSDIYTQDEQQIRLFNDGKAAEGIALVVNRRAAMKAMTVPSNPQGLKIDKKHHAFLQIAALFLIREDEDMTKFDQEFQDTKIQDWLDSGVSYEDLFTLAVNTVPGLLAACQEVSQTISQTSEQQMTKMANELKNFTSDTEK